MLETFGPEGLAIYVHWPWCLHKCPYCDFNSHAAAPQHAPYVQALNHEIRHWESLLHKDQTIVSIYFGGGTPSLMDPDDIKRLINTLSHLGRITAETEISMECNPTSASKPLLKAFREAGINRLSIGIQGLKDEWLRFLGRQHSTEQALETLGEALSLFETVNADVIYGLPEQHLDDWTRQLDKLAQMGLQHISAYQLTIEPQTRFFSDVKRGLWTPIDDDTERLFFDATRTHLANAGYQNYETSNFSRPGKACIHNQHIWRYGSYIGIGAGAHGRPKLPDGTRLATSITKLPQAYMGHIDTQGHAFVENEPLTLTQQVQEALFLGLRLEEGISLDLLQKHFGKTACEAALDLDFCALGVEQHLLYDTPGQLRLTEQGWPLLNGVLRHLLKSA